MRSFAGARGTGHRDAHVSSHESGVQDQLCQKPAGSLPEDRVSRLVNRLSGILLERRIVVFYQCLAQFRKGNLASFRTHGHDGFVAVCGPAGLAKNERLSVLVSCESSVSSPAAPLAQSENIHGVRDGSSSVEKPLCILDSWGGMSLRKVGTTDTSLMGWGAVFQSILANGQWTPQHRKLHVNMLELVAVFLALKHCLESWGRFPVRGKLAIWRMGTPPTGPL